MTIGEFQVFRVTPNRHGEKKWLPVDDLMLFDGLLGKKSARGREGAGDVSCEGPISSWMCCIDQKKLLGK